ncbi:hypothetical protein KR009_000630, partial [Drosophila setifemur]
IRQAAKQGKVGHIPFKDLHPDPEPSYSWPSSSPPMEWGTSNGSEILGPKELKPGENPLKESHIFHVLWRNQTNKKHKTWTGNGTLVITGSKMTLKDETGKAVDSLNCFKQLQIKENDQLQIGSKDVEVQEEIKSLEECVAQRKLEIASWCQRIDARNGHVDVSPPPAGNLPFRSHVLKKRMRTESPTNRENPNSSRFSQVEYICLLSPAELQDKILHFLCEKSKSSKLDFSVIADLAKDVCDHPVLLKTRATQSDSLELMQLLQPHLPPWPEMEIYDSAKFEFVHLMLDDLVVERREKCCIVADSQDCLRLVKGYCQSWDLAHLQLDGPEQVASFNSCAEEAPKVALVLTNRLPEIQSLHCKNLIIYNHNARRDAEQLLAKGNIDTKIYTLISGGGCPEERSFYRKQG